MYSSIGNSEEACFVFSLGRASIIKIPKRTSPPRIIKRREEDFLRDAFRRAIKVGGRDESWWES